ncbi:MAG: hypothetical protein V3U03_15920 [Myxococcota bacterium]
MTRWLLVALGLGIAGAALYALVEGGRGPRPLDEIDDASRARLDRVLRDAEQQERQRP